MKKADHSEGGKKKPAGRTAEAGGKRPAPPSAKRLAPQSPKTREVLDDHQARASFHRQQARMDERTGGLAARAKELYHDLFEFAPVGYLEINPDYLIINANLTASRVLHLERAKLCGRPLSALVPADHQTQCFQFLRGLLDQAGGQTGILPLKVGAKTIWARLEGIPVTDASGTVHGARVSFLDVTAQIEAEQALAQSEQRYRGLVELSPAPVIVHRSGRILYANPAAAAIFGVGSAEELAGRSSFDFIAPEFQELVRERVRKVQEEGKQAPRREVRLVRADGREVWIEAAASRITYQGEPAIQVIYHDLTERRKAETSAREAAEEWRRTFDTIPDPIMIIDDRQRLVRMNATASQMLGQDPPELLGRQCYELIHDNCQPHGRCPHLQTLADGQEHVEEVYEPKFKRHFLVTTTPMIGSEGRANATVHVMRDITAAKQAAHALAESERKFRNIIASSPLGFQMYELRPDGELIFIEANRAADTILGIDNAQFFGRTAEEAFPSIVGTEVGGILRRVAQGGDPKMIENYSYQDDKLAGVFELFFFQVAPGYSACLFRDVSERRRLELELEAHRARLAELLEARTAEVHEVILDLSREVNVRHRAELEIERQRTLAIRADRLRSLGEMAAGISHELNQPLMGIRNLAEHMQISLQKGWDMPLQTIERKTADIIAQVDRMSNVIEHTRRFARGGSADPEAQQAVSVNEVIADAMRLIGAQLKARGINLALELAPDLPRPRLNPYSLEEVILNLMSNARDAVEQAARKGEVPAAAITVRTFSVGEGPAAAVKIQIADQGPGIPPEVMDKLFEPFFTTKPPGQGTGLGLSICKSLVESWNGRIEVESSPGRGATATVTLSCPQDG